MEVKSETGTGELGAGNADDVEGFIAQRFRAERERRGLSLRRLASRLQISASALSQIETGRSRPSVRTLYALVNELGISLDDLLRTPSDDAGETVSKDDRRADPGGEDELVQHAEHRKVIELAGGVRWERLNPLGDRDVEFLEVEYAVGGASSPGNALMRHSGSEYGLVLSGRLRVTVGFEDYEMAPGDSISFDSTFPHRLENVGSEPVRAIWFVLGRTGSDPRARWHGESDH